MTAPHHSGYSAGSLSPLRQGFEASRLWQQAITIFVSIFGAVLGPTDCCDDGTAIALWFWQKRHHSA
jgi:hypothetical protein